MTDPTAEGPPGDIPNDEPTPGRAVGPRMSNAQRLAQAQALLMAFATGREPVELCADYGISRSTLYRRLREARDFVVSPKVEEYRKDAQARIRLARQVAYRTLAQPGLEPTEVASLLGRLNQLEQTEARLLGGYAPTRVDVRVEQADAWAALERALAEQAGAEPATEEARP